MERLKGGQNVVHTTDLVEKDAIIRNLNFEIIIRKLNYGGGALTQFAFMSNARKIGTWFAEGKDIRPSIWFDRSNGKHETAEL
jgi:hypothetical protein